MKHIWLLVIFAISSPALIHAQESKPAHEFIEAQRERAEKRNQHGLTRSEAVNLVERTAAEAPLWDDKKTAVRVLAEAADLLWHENSAHAIKWLTKAWTLIDDVSEPTQNDKLREFFRHSDR